MSCEDVELIDHTLERSNQRYINSTHVKESLINKSPLGIIKTRENRFKVIYPHETKSSKDLHIIIEISDDKKIIVITIYPDDKRKRVK